MMYDTFVIVAFAWSLMGFILSVYVDAGQH